MRTVFTLIAALVCAVATAAPKLISGSLDILKNEQRVSVTLDCSETVYGKDKPFEKFLKKARRDANWERKSVDYFVEKFNDETRGMDFQAFSQIDNVQCKYAFVIKPLKVTGGGSITGHLQIVEIKTQEVKATILFSAEGDDDDSIALRDSMKEAGEEMGKFLKSKLKKIKKR